MKVLTTLAYILVVLGSAASLICLIGISTATGAPQEAAIGALACAFVVVPYCVARAFEFFSSGKGA